MRFSNKVGVYDEGWLPMRVGYQWGYTIQVEVDAQLAQVSGRCPVSASLQ